MNDFECEALHRQEIETSRVGGFGSSDAKLFAKIGEKGLILNNSDIKRIAVAMGVIPYESIAPNKAMIAGHKFEDYGERMLYYCEREKKIERKLAKNFKTFAHADFFDNQTNCVYELKYSQKPTSEVIQNYKHQLQWYYILGVEDVKLVHGWGNVEPFEPRGCDIEPIGVTEYIREYILKGIKILDKAISDNYFKIDFAKLKEQNKRLNK